MPSATDTPVSARRRTARQRPDPSSAPPVAAPARGMTWQARLLHSVNRVYVHGYHRLQVQTPPTLPERGPAILVCNHISGLDPLLIQAALDRPVVWMMASEYYRLPVLGWVFRSVDAIPVDRSGRDTVATRAALRVLADGKILGIFPEGKIEKSRDLLPFQTGVAMMAARAAYPFVRFTSTAATEGWECYPPFSLPTNRAFDLVLVLTLYGIRETRPILTDSPDTSEAPC